MTGNSTTISECKAIIDWYPYYAVRIAGEWVLDWVRPDGVDKLIQIGGSLTDLESLSRIHKARNREINRRKSF